MKRLTLPIILTLLMISLLSAVGYDPDIFVPRSILTCFKMESIGRFDGRIDFTMKNGVVHTKMKSFNELAKKYNIVDLMQLHDYVKVPSWNEDGRYLQCVYRIVLADDSKMDETVSALEKNSHILYAELEPIYRAKYIPNDPLISQQYALNVMRCYDAWDYVTGSASVSIGISDSGVKWNHPDLQDNIWVNTPELAGMSINWTAGTVSGGNGIDDDGNGKIDDVIGWDFYHNDNNPYQNFANNDHGTHVAGCAGAVFNNGIGVAGSCPVVKIICAKGAPDNTNMQGISNGYDQAKYAAESGADVVNASWGGQASSLNYPNSVVNYITNLGCLFVTAAGNNNMEHNSSYIDAPGDCTNALCVAATGPNDVKTDFSDYGIPIDICAPGQTILSTIIEGNSYAAYDGTSMASPLAAGVAALVKAINPNLNAYELRQRLELTADWIYHLNPNYAPAGTTPGKLGSGRVNAFAAAMYDKIPYLHVEDFEFSEESGDGDSIPNPGELVKLNIQLTNFMDPYTGLMWVNANNIVAKLRCDMPGVAVVDSVSLFGTLGSGASNWNYSDPFTFQTVSTLPSVPIPFKLYITANNTAQYPYTAIREFDISLSLVQNGWPVNLNGASQSSACLENMDSHYDKEIIFGDHTGKIHIRKANGTSLANFPYQAPAGVIGALAMHDINADSSKEIVANLNNSTIICINKNAQLQWTAPSGGTLVGNPIIANLNMSGAPEIVAFTQTRYIVALKADGTAYPNFPIQIEGAMLTNGAVADLNGDGQLEIIVATLTGKLHAINSATGQSLAGFPVDLGSGSRNQPTIANLDGDNNPEILIPTYSNGQLFAINHDGSILFQKNIGTQIKGGAVVADVNGDGNKEIIIIAFNGDLYITNTSGVNLPGFPLNIGENVESTPIVAKFDGNNLSGIIFGDANGKIHSFRSDGTESANFPITIGGNIKVSAAIAHVDTDNDVDLIFPNDACFYFIDLKRAASSYQWPFYMYNLSRSGNVHQSTPNQGDNAPQLETTLSGNYPNPFSTETVINYSLKSPATVSIDIFNLKGQKVKTLVSDKKTVGNHSIAWNGMDDNNKVVSSGVYFYKMQAGSYSDTRKMMLMK